MTNHNSPAPDPRQEPIAYSRWLKARRDARNAAATPELWLALDQWGAVVRTGLTRWEAEGLLNARKVTSIAPEIQPGARAAAVCEGCGLELADAYLTARDGTKWHRSCRDEVLLDRDHRSDAAANRAEREIDRRMP